VCVCVCVCACVRARAITMDVGNILLVPDCSQHPYGREYISFVTPNIRISINLSIMHFTKPIPRSIILYKKVTLAQLLRNFFACYTARKFIAFSSRFFWHITLFHCEIGFRRLEGTQCLFFSRVTTKVLHAFLYSPLTCLADY
jgi:hypothetical protein